MLRVLLTTLIVVSVTLAVPNRLARGQTPTETQVRDLIQQLGAPRFEDRERAEQQLQAMGSFAYELLLEHRRDPDIEIRVRACRLVAKLQEDFLLEDVDPALEQFLTDYSSDNVDRREAKIILMATLLPQQAIQELSRITRYDDSERLSKIAALAIIRGTYPTAGLDRRELANSIRDGVGISGRHATKWLSAYADALDQTSADITRSWEQWLKDEEKKLELESDETTSRQVVVAMRQLLGDLYQLAGRNDDARTARRVVSQSLAANPESIDEWTAWLLDRSAWDAVSDLAELQNETLLKQPKLLYALAESRSQLKGDAEKINQLLDQALQAADASDDREHYESALFLEETRGQFAWAEREYRFLIEKADQASLFRTNAFYRLAGLYHKQQQYAKAAEELQKLLTEVQSSAEVREALQEGLGSSVDAADCQRHYYLALDAESRGDEAGKRDELQKAVDIDPEQADVLIAMYRVKDADAAWSEQVRELIRASAERLQREIIGLRRQEEVAGDLASRTSGQTLSGTLNNYAWLISNTEGDFEEALRFSQQSLLLSPGDAGLLDTLARCYYSVGELDKALKYQRWAVQRDPHETQVRRQLEFFESELASQQKPVPAPETQSKSDG